MNNTLLKMAIFVAITTSLTACSLTEKIKAEGNQKLKSATTLIKDSANAQYDKLIGGNKSPTLIPSAFVIDGQSRYLPITKVVKPTGKAAAEIQKAIDNTNKLRTEKGLPALKYDPNLAAYAQMRAEELSVTKIGHIRPNGSQAYGYIYNSPAWTMENVAAGHASADETVLTQWRNSPGHYRAMTSPEVKSIGIGMVQDPNSQYKYYWVQIFGYAGATVPFEFLDNQNPKPLAQIITDRYTLPLALNKAGEWQKISGAKQSGWLNGYESSRFGVVFDDNQGYQFFHQGLQPLAIEIPKSGRASYYGKGLMVKGDVVDNSLNAKLTVDFEKRTLVGILQNPNTTIHLSADVNGNGFASQINAPVATQGAFYGKQGMELSGTFVDSINHVQGVFGAKR